MNYKESGVDYDPLDSFKQFSQNLARQTEKNLPQSMRFVEASRGESASVFDAGTFYLAGVDEGLGTKNIVADAVGRGEETYYDVVGWDTAASIINDLLTVGSRPFWVNAHWAFGSSKIFEQKPQRAMDLAKGWTAACQKSGVLFAGGETPILKGIIYPGRAALSGSGIGIIDPKERLTLGEKLTAGDHIIIIKSSGIMENGLTLTREIAHRTGYQGKLPSGRTFGVAIMTPSYIYTDLVANIFDAGILPHYMVHITGHGWRKLMRAKPEFTYVMHTVPPVLEEMAFMQDAGDISNTEMYKTFNMGAGFAIMVAPQDAEGVREQAESLGYDSWDAGVVEQGPRRVVIEPKGITFDTLWQSQK